MGRERDSGETEREGREAEHLYKRGMMSVINLTIRENIYDLCKRIIQNNQGGCKLLFSQAKNIFSVILL